MTIEDREPNYQFLNIAGPNGRLWTSFKLVGLEADEHGLRLVSLPRIGENVGAPLGNPQDFAGPAGIGIAADGTIYLSDPANHQILRFDSCEEVGVPIPCLTGPGSEPGYVDTPRGVLVGPRNALYIADSRNHRIQIVDLLTGQLRAIWGQDERWGRPEPSTDPGGFIEPWDLTSDCQGDVYVADPGLQAEDATWSGGRVQKFNPDGRVIPEFWDTLQAQTIVPSAPVAVATILIDPNDQMSERLLIVDAQPPRLLVYTLDGQLDDDETERWTNVANLVRAPIAFAHSSDALYIADMTANQVLVFDRNGRFIGKIPSGDHQTSALAIDRQGRLLLYSNEQSQLQRFDPGGAYVETGTFIAGPFEAGPFSTTWHRLVIDSPTSSASTHVQLYTLVTNSNIQVTPPGNNPTPPWNALPRNCRDTLITDNSGQYLWVAGIFVGDGLSTPIINQIRVEHSHHGWINHLPAIYLKDDESRDFLVRTLALFEGLLADKETLIDDLPLLFNAGAAPDQAPHRWLNWLAGWVDQTLDDEWTDKARRDAVSRAFLAHANRGTVSSLRELIQLHTGTTALISEPVRHAGVWMLDHHDVALDFETRLASAEAQGAVLASTATLTQSHLVDGESFGAPLFEELAHRFCVQVYAAELTNSSQLDEIQMVIDQEKPAHTSYHLCAIDAEMRVGFQSRIGIDTIIAGQNSATNLSGDQQLDVNTALVGSPEQSRIGGMIGLNTRIGTQTQLT